MTTTSWTVGGASNPVHYGYKSYHKNNFADQLFSNQPGHDTTQIHVLRERQLEAAAARQPEGVTLTEKRKELDMLRSYDPWGKPAVGAPRITSNGKINARRIVTYEQALPTNTAQDDPHRGFGKPGGGAPLRTVSGRIQVALKADMDIRFQKQHKRDVEATLRHRSVEGRNTSEEHSVFRTESEKDRLAQEWEKKALYAKKLEQQLAEQIKREVQHAVEAKAPRPVYFPWGKDKLSRDDSGKIAGRKCALTTPHEKQPHLLPNSSGVQATPHALYYPWGRPGAGAPLRDEQGHPKVALHGTLLREQTNTQEHPLAGLGTRGDQTRLTRREDVTAAHALQSQKHQYYVDLVEQAKQRQQRLQLQREKEREIDKHHVSTAIHFLADSHHHPNNHARRSWEKSDLDKVQKKREYCADLQKSIIDKVQQRQEEKLRERELEKRVCI